MKHLTTVYSLSCILLISVSLSPFAAKAQDSKKGGIFKFGKKEEGVSAGLFPEKDSTKKKWVPGKEGENMFIKPSGNTDSKPKPAPVKIFKPASAEKIQPVPKPVTAKDKKKGGFFSFRKKSTKDSPSSNTTVAPIPEKVRHQPFKPTTGNTLMKPEGRVATSDQTNTSAKKEKNAGGLFSFLPGRKKNSNTENDLKKIADSPLYNTPSDSRSPDRTTQPVAPPKPAPVVASAVTATEQLIPAQTTPPVNPAKKEKHKIGFPGLNMPSLPKIKKSSKKTNYSAVETVMKDGVFVEKSDSNTTLSNAPVQPTEHRRPPKIVNGVKTYSTWDDVESRSSSAADKILSQLR